MRLETTINDSADAAQVEWLNSTLRTKTAELVRDAIMVLGWAVREVSAGRRIASVDSQGNNVREFTSPLLERAGWIVRERLVLEPESTERIAELVQNPPAPNAALRELMQESS